jgi:hypothetical protein
MSQHDYNIANGGGAAVRADINNALLAVLSQNSGATAPTTTKPFMFWYDTTTGIFKIRNAADSAWVTFAAGAIADASIAQAKLAAGVAGTGPAFSAYLTGAQFVTTNVSTKVTLNTKEFDTASCFNNTGSTVGGIPAYAFMPNVAGYYQFSAQLGGNATGVQTQVEARILKNGVIVSDANIYLSTGALNNCYVTASKLLYLNGSTDYVEFYGLVQAANTPRFDAGAAYTYLTGLLVRAA